MGKTQREQRKVLEFGEKEYKEIDNYCKEKIYFGLLRLGFKKSKVFEKFNLKYNKIASAMIVDREFLEEVAKQKRYTFISTGMSTFKIIDEAVEIFKRNNRI